MIHLYWLKHSNMVKINAWDNFQENNAKLINFK